MTSDPVLPGWVELSPEFLDHHRTELAPADLNRFWDGAQPDWPHALASQENIPRRQLVAEAVAFLEKATTAATTPAMAFLVGPGGQGKSTAIRQAAVDLAAAVAAAAAADPELRILFRQPGARCDPDAVAALPAGPRWILASDDADEIAREVERAVGRRQDVHWLLAARDTDWARQFPRDEPWERLGASEWPARAARAETLDLTDHDASVIGTAWRTAGPSGTSLLEGVLAARRPDLGRTLASLDPPLRTAFNAAAAAAAVGIDGVDLRVMAHLTGVDREDRTAIRTALGQAGLATGTGEALRTRHPSVAREAVRLMGSDLGEVLVALVRATADVARDTRPLVSDGAIVTGAPTLAARLIDELGLPEPQAHEIACSAADAAADVLDNLLMTVVSRSRTYRNAGAAAAADGILRRAIPTAAGTDDWAETARHFVCELSLTVASPEAAIVVAGVSLADLRGLGPISMVEARPSLTRLGQACADGDDGRLVRAVAWLGRRVTPNFDPAKRDFRRWASVADDRGVPECTSAEAVQWLGEGVAAAFATVEDPDVHDLLGLVLPDGNLGFMQLQRTADRGANLIG